MRKVSRILLIFVSLFVFISMYCVSFASTWETALKVVKRASDVKYFSDGKGKMTHEIVSCDQEKGEIKLRLTVTNIAGDADVVEGKDTEIYIILSENLVTEPSKYATYCRYIETLAGKIFAKNAKAKVGIIGMRGPNYDWTMSEEGRNIRGPADEGDVDGKENDSELVVKATNNLEQLKTALANMNSEKKSYYANLQSALITAENSFEEDSNKIVVSLYDNVPHVSVGTHDKIVYMTADDAYEEVVARNGELVKNTKAEFLNLEKAGINFILLRPMNTSFDQSWYSYDTGDLILTFDGSSYVENLYGSFEKPTYGKMYSILTESLEKIVTENMYTDIVEMMGTKLISLKIREYLTKEIMDNFTMTIDDKDEDVDLSRLGDSRYFTWNIPELESGDTAILNYTLRIKDMNNTEIFNKILSINEKIDIIYEDSSGEERTETELTSPQVRLEAVRKDPENTNTNTNTSPNNIVNNTPNTNIANNNVVDNTTAPTILPKTGSKIMMAILLAMTIIGGFVLYVKYRNLDDVP